MIVESGRACGEQLSVSRQREYLADATGVQLLGRGSPLADALENARTPRTDLPPRRQPGDGVVYIVNPLRMQGVATPFSTHPPITERVRRLGALDSDQTFRVVAAQAAGV